MKFSKITLFCLLLMHISCIQNPEAEFQNQKIKDLQEKFDYLNLKISELNEKNLDLKNELHDVKLSNSKIPDVIYKTRRIFPDSIVVKVNMEK